MKDRLENFRKYLKRELATHTRKKARERLLRAGIIDESGKLSKWYRDEPPKSRRSSIPGDDGVI